MRIEGHGYSISEEINFTDINESQYFKRMGVSKKGCIVNKNASSGKIQGRSLSLANKEKTLNTSK